MLGAAAALAAGPMSPIRPAAHVAPGVVDPPVPVPSIGLTTASGLSQPLAQALTGHLTAVQLMFTTCSATCPIQGALFGELQRQLARSPLDWRLLSISIDALGDTPARLRGWLLQHGARADRWTAAVVSVRDVERLLDFVRGRASGPDRHTPQVYVFDAQARLRVRSTDLPPPVAVATLMREVAARP